MKDKKGVIEVQFNWIFILVAGAVILLFFVGIVQKQKEVSSSKINVDIRGKLKTIMMTAKQSTGTVFSFKLPKEEIEYSEQGFSVGGTQPIQLGESFAPNLIRSSTGNIFFWALSWDVPYKVSNFFYVTSPDIRYVIINDASSNLDDELYNLLADNITKEVNNDIANLQDLNHYKIRFVYFADPSNEDMPAGVQDRDVSAVFINPDDSCGADKLDCYGEVTFYKKNNAGIGFTAIQGPSYYLKKESLIGAVFSEDKESYEASMKKAMRKLKAVTEVYKKRTEGLYVHISDLPSPSDYCTTYTSYPTVAEENQQTGLLYDLVGYTEDAFNKKGDIYSITSQLESLNKNTFQMNSCPLLY